MGEKVVERFAGKFQLSQAVSSRAAEFYRLAEVKGVLRMRGVGSTGLALACLEISAGVAGESFDKTQAQRISGLQTRVYTSTVQNLRKILNVSSILSLRDMAVKFGCLEVQQFASDTLRNYREKIESSCSDEQKDCLDFSKPLYPAAALYTACKVMKFRCERSQFQSVAGCTSRSVFQTVLDQMKDCVPAIELKKRKSGRKRKLRGGGAGGEDEETDPQPDAVEHSSTDENRGGGVGGGMGISLQSNFTRERLWNRVVSSPVSEDYLQWKETILTTARTKIAQ